MIRIREASLRDAAGIARVHVDSWRSTYVGILPAGYLAGLTYIWPEIHWKRILSDPKSREFVFVAENATGKIAGFATGGPEQSGHPVYQGELYGIYLLKEYQRQGTGRELVRAVVSRLKERGYPNMLVWVLAENPSRTFYERMGGIRVEEKEVDIEKWKLPGIAYAWDDLSIMLKS